MEKVAPLQPLPRNGDLEKRLLEQLAIRDSNDFSYVITKITTNDFYYDAHKIIFMIMCKLFKKGMEIEGANIYNELTDKDKEKVSLAYITDICYSHDLFSLDPIINDLRQLSLDRYTLLEIKKIELNIYNRKEKENKNEGKYDSTEDIGRLHNALLRDNNKGSGSINIAEAMEKTWNAVLKGDDPDSRFLTGLNDLDKILRGLRRKELTLIGARPAMGKTTFALALLEYISRSRHVLFHTMEQDVESLGQKLLSSQTHIKLENIQEKKITEKQLKRLEIQKDYIIQHNNIHFDETADLTPGDIKSSIIKNKQLYDIDVVVIDYTQMVSYDDSKPLTKEIGDFARGLKKLAKSLNISIILLAQLNRKCEERNDKRPYNPDLKDSGALEEASDKIMFLYRDAVYNKDTESPNILEVIVTKNKVGATGTAELFIDLDLQLICNSGEARDIE